MIDFIIDFIISIFTYQAPNVNQAILPFIAAVGMLAGMSSARKGRAMAARFQQENLERQKLMDERLEKQRDEYRAMEFKNPYENMDNNFEGMKNSFSGMENTMEDLEVNTQQADFMQRQSQQNTANILQGLQGAAGGSGVAGLAQALANQGLNQAAQSSASIGQQEASNARLKAQEGSRIQQMVRGEDSRIQQMVMGEDARLQMAERGGAANVEQAERDRQATLLGMAQGQSAGANAAVQQGYSNQMAAQSANTTAMFGVAGAAFGATTSSDWTS